MRARKNAELEESVIRMAAMLKIGAWGPMKDHWVPGRIGFQGSVARPES